MQNWVEVKGPDFKGIKLKKFSSTSHENTSQEEAAQMLVHNVVHPGPKQSVPLDVQAGTH